MKKKEKGKRNGKAPSRRTRCFLRFLHALAINIILNRIRTDSHVSDPLLIKEFETLLTIILGYLVVSFIHF
jgi:hypothetical protein